MRLVADGETPEQFGNIPACPERIKGAGRELWDRIRDEGYFLRSDEIDLLEQIAHCRAIVELLEKQVDDVFETKELFVMGSQGQPVTNPLLSELRQYRAQFAKLVQQLKLPALEEGDESSRESASAAGTALVNVRYRK